MDGLICNLLEGRGSRLHQEKWPSFSIKNVLVFNQKLLIIRNGRREWVLVVMVVVLVLTFTHWLMSGESGKFFSPSLYSSSCCCSSSRGPGQAPALRLGIKRRSKESNYCFWNTITNNKSKFHDREWPTLLCKRARLMADSKEPAACSQPTHRYCAALSSL